MTRTPPEIEVTSGGPYRVTGDIDVLSKRIVTSDQGEPLAWAASESIPHSSEVLMCRCGESNTKPFCDESHLVVEFDGTENASPDTFAEAEKVYSGPGLTVHRVGRLCEHASFCANETTDWYQMLPESSDVNVRTQIIGMIEHCPSGALVYEIDGETVEPDLSVAISPVEDGPYWLWAGDLSRHLFAGCQPSTVMTPFIPATK